MWLAQVTKGTLLTVADDFFGIFSPGDKFLALGTVELAGPAQVGRIRVWSLKEQCEVELWEGDIEFVGYPPAEA